MIKTCSRCSQSKDATLFPKAPTCKDGYRSYCKSCNKLRVRKYQQSEEGRAVVNEASRRWSKENRQKVLLIKKKWRDNNKEKQAAAKASWKKRNKGLTAAYCAARRARVKQAIPNWYNKREVQRLYKKAGMLGLQVDHIVPLKSKYVCGLHVANNLQLLSPDENAKKGNFWWPGMPTSSPS